MFSIVDGHLFAFMTFGRCSMLFVNSAVYPRFRVLHQPAATTDVALVLYVV
jgi:hypothetical protein